MILRDFYQYQSYLLFHFDLNLADDDENLIDFLCSPLQLDRSTINPVYHSRFQHPPPAVTTVNCSSPAMLNNNDNKENFNDQNLSLSEDPQQTKRSTKTWGMQFKEKFSLTKVLVQLTKAPSGSVSPGGPRPSTLSSQRRLLNSCTLTADKTAGLRRGSSLIPEKKPNSASSSSSRPYVIRSSKTSVNLSKDKHLSTDLRPRQSVEGTKIGQKTTPHPVLCADNHNAVTESRAEVDNPAAHNTNCISEDIPNPLTQPTKVTGLLMPSPSLRFFDQPKSSASHSNQSVTAQLSNHRASKM